MKYKCFDKFWFRIPFLDNLQYINAGTFITDEVLDALFISSNHAYEAISAYVTLNDFKNLPLPIRYSLAKYQIRMSTRSTPFGIFAGVGIGSKGTKNSILIEPKKSFKAITSLNLPFFADLQKQIEQAVGIRELVLFPNSTIFLFNNHFRYTERRFLKEEDEFVISEVPFSEYLELILTKASNGASGKSLIDTLVNEFEVEDEGEAMQFIEDLLTNQVLVSEFSLGVTVGDSLKYYAHKIEQKNLDPLFSIRDHISDIADALAKVNNSDIGNRRNKIIHLHEYLRKNERLGNSQHGSLTKTNLYVSPVLATINQDLIDLVAEGVRALNTLTRKTEQTYLGEFRRKFFEMYEFEEIPLLEALDPDIGIGFAVFSSENLMQDELLKNLVHPVQPQEQLSSIEHGLLHRKYLEFLTFKHNEIVLTEADLNSFETNWDDLPKTFPAGIEVYQAGTCLDPLIYLKFAGGFSAANVIARFCLDSPELEEMARSIIHTEDKLHEADSIVAEIAFLPESIESGVILSRPMLRDIEIPILTFNAGAQITTIPLSDLMLSIDDNYNLVLRSKTLNKKVLPKNTTAHSFTERTNPVYYFLSALQAYNVRYKFLFSWGTLNPVDGFFPRVRFKDHIILSLAKWVVSSSEIIIDDRFISAFDKLRAQRGIPELVLLKSGFDNALLLDFSLDVSYEIMKKELKKGPLTLEEYLFTNADPLVCSGDKAHNNEVILNFYRSDDR